MFDFCFLHPPLHLFSSELMTSSFLGSRVLGEAWLAWLFKPGSEDEAKSKVKKDKSAKKEPKELGEGFDPAMCFGWHSCQVTNAIRFENQLDSWNPDQSKNLIRDNPLLQGPSTSRKHLPKAVENQPFTTDARRPPRQEYTFTLSGFHVQTFKNWGGYRESTRFHPMGF